MMVLIRFWRSLNKKKQLTVLDMKYNIFFYFQSDLDPDSAKRSDPDPGGKNQIRNTAKYSYLEFLPSHQPSPTSVRLMVRTSPSLKN